MIARARWWERTLRSEAFTRSFQQAAGITPAG